ncbi:ABC transporter substrate-binding protein [Acidipropionibacterium jensenii]|uniref:ABC transporter substrate-binding protein n=1 Tax=Acidipropionibacterium jensenii TaxID=1749 RepID=UPI00214CCCE6|nr:ABC transporter substrate-binding protein [Acidipropionibacterium jensenii]
MQLTSRRHFLGLVGLGAAAVSQSACSAGAPASDSSASGSAGGSSTATLKVGFAAIPQSLDFTTTAGAAIIQALVGNVYEGLVQLADDGSIKPLLAKSWKINDDGLSYDFTLREGVTFHNGTKFDAEVVKFSLERIPKWTANTPGNLAAIDHVDVVSATEAKVVLKQADFSALFWLAGPLGAMFDKGTISTLSTKPVGTGPFTFGSYARNSKMILNRNDSYWGTKALVRTAEFDYFADATAAANALRSGGVDALYQAEALDQVASFQSDSRFEVTKGTTQGVVVMSMNSMNGLFSNPKLRQAVMYGVDRKAVLAAAASGYGTVLGGPAVPTDPYFVDYAGKYPFDAAKAKQLVAESGVTDLNVNFTVPVRPYAQAVAQVAQQQLNAIGFTVKLVPQEFPAVWLDKTLTQHQFDLTVTNHVEPRSVTNYANPKYYWSYDNAAVQKLFADAAAAKDDAAFVDDTKKAVAQIVTDAPGNWLYNPPNIVITRKGVSGFTKNYMGVGINLAGVSAS